jgi:hypothetical protein
MTAQLTFAESETPDLGTMMVARIVALGVRCKSSPKYRTDEIEVERRRYPSN